MPRYLILAQSKITANALGACLELLGERQWQIDNDPRAIVWERDPDLDAYETLTRRIENLAVDRDGVIPINKVVILVDSVNTSQFRVVTSGASWDSLIAMLILTFPEIRWVFGICSGKLPKRWKNMGAAHRLNSLFEHGPADPLFDPSGLRDFVRFQTNSGLKEMGDDLRLPRRKHLTAVIEEEKSYAYFHGCVAYRFGFRADLVTTWARMKERFGSKEKRHGYWLILEDLSLNFPDRKKNVHLLHLAVDYEENEGVKRNGRAYHAPQLDSTNPNIENSEYRVLVTTGQSRRHSTLAENCAYLRGKKYGRGKVVLKPTRGMFDLWKRAGLFRRHFKAGRPGNAPGYCWPPLKPATDATDIRGHGAPGKLLLVAEKLIDRAGAALDRVRSVEDAVRGAVLATEALELTGGRTPTTAIEALSLKHRFEILAECQFSGVENNLSIKRRLDEVYQNTTAICGWFTSRQRQNAILNARMHILNQLVHTLREQNQFDEEQICMNRVRQIHDTLWMRARPWRYLFWPAVRYVELLLRSIPAFTMVLACWLVVLGLLFAWVEPSVAQWGLERLGGGLESAVTAFFSVGLPIQHGTPPTSLTIPQVIVRGIAIISGFLHLGIFISHLYVVVSRR